MSMDEDEAKCLSLQLMEVAKAAFLTTIDADGYPYTRGMFNLRNIYQFPHLRKLFYDHRDDFLVLFSTNTSSNKTLQAKNNSAVSVYYCKSEEGRGLMLGGDIEICSDLELKRALWQESWKRYYPRGVDDPDYTVLSLYPLKGRYYHRLLKRDFSLKGKK